MPLCKSFNGPCPTIQSVSVLFLTGIRKEWCNFSMGIWSNRKVSHSEGTLVHLRLFLSSHFSYSSDRKVMGHVISANPIKCPITLRSDE